MSKINDYTNTKLIQPIKKYAFVFVCQKGRLEIESLFLAASLKKFLKCNYELIAMIPLPESVFGKPSDITLDLFLKMGVKIQKIKNEFVAKNPNLDFSVPKNRTMLFANKIYCLKIKTDADKIIFLDSDTILNKEFAGDICFSIPINLKLDGIGGAVPVNGKWDQIFKVVGAKMPSLRMRINKQMNENPKYPDYVFAPSCFNGGFFSINTEFADQFARQWSKSYKKIISANFIDNSYFLEQIAFNATIHKIKIPFNMLNLDYKGGSPFFHYFSSAKMKKLKNNTEMINLAKSFLKEYPEITNLIKNNENWAFLLD